MTAEGLAGAGAAFVILICVLIVIFAPFAVIWALNTLFGLSIVYTFWTWLAVIVLNLTWAGKVRLNKS